jgi:RNA polymerase sigma factor (sigma-70 family)
MTDDRQLLRQFAEQNAQDAFTELVRRHAGWIFQASLRRTGERRDLAQDVVQHVFIALARHAPALSDHESLVGWLYTTTRFAANHVLRAESRRSKYESVATTMTDSEPSNTDENWSEIRPLLDEAIDRLPRRDRDTLLQRFFEGSSFAEMTAVHGVSEAGVRKRLDRALEKLRVRLGRRGISSTATALGALLGSQAGAAAPQAIYALAAAAPSSALAAIQPPFALGALHFMSTTKTALVGAGLIGIAATLSSVIFAVRETRAERVANDAVASMTRKIALDEARLRQVERNVRAGLPSPTGRAIEPEEPAPEIVPPRATPAGAGSSSSTARADGQAFLLQQAAARAMLAEQFRAQAARTNALFYRIASLSPTQIDAFESRLVQQWLETLEVTPSGINPGQPDLPAPELASILGPEGLIQWQTFERERVADYFAKNVALSVKNAADPLTTAQMVQLVTIISQNSPEFRAGGSINPATVDWATALAQAEKTMHPVQWREAQPWLQKTYVDAQLKSMTEGAP